MNHKRMPRTTTKPKSLTNGMKGRKVVSINDLQHMKHKPTIMNSNKGGRKRAMKKKADASNIS